MSETLTRIECGAQDWFNFIAAEIHCNYQLNCVMELDRYIDKEIFAKALSLLMEEEPVLRSRFIVRENQAYWEFHPDFQLEDFLTFVKTDDPDRDVLQFVNRPMREGIEPVFHVCIFHGQASETICIKLSHSCADGRGTKEFTERLNEIYNRLDAGQEVALKQFCRTRRQEKLFKHLTLEQFTDSLLSEPAEDSSGCKFPYLSDNVKKGQSSIAVKYLPQNEFKRICHAGKKYGATVNDLFITSLFRANWALEEPSEQKHSSLGCTVDLRQYLPEKTLDTISNLSSLFEIVIEKNTNETFSETLKKVVTETKKLKKRFLGADYPFTYEILSRIGFEETYRYTTQQHPEHSKSGPAFILSNLGVIGEGKMSWGNALVNKLFITGPALNPPMSLMLATTYDDTVAFTFAYSRLAVTKTVADAFLELVLEELKSLD